MKRHPDSSLAYTKRGVRYLWLGDLKHAESDLEHAIRLDPDNAEAHEDLGVILAQRGETEKAMVHFEQTIRLDPSYQKGHHNMAMSLYIEGKPKPALIAINNALKLIPNAQNSLLLKAEILEALGHSREAEMIRSDAEFLPGGNWSEQFSVKN
ncbi:MAG: tetratricopeptide repeat protein [Gammaproteobacteria bacterium]|nr:tetratricopeptide repeat protein [Gammaproteobacteria bacterium]